MFSKFWGGCFVSATQHQFLAPFSPITCLPLPTNVTFYIFIKI